jgi:hypothetical protein
MAVSLVPSAEWLSVLNLAQGIEAVNERCGAEATGPSPDAMQLRPVSEPAYDGRAWTSKSAV